MRIINSEVGPWGKEYAEELKYYKETGNMTSSLSLNMTMIFMNKYAFGKKIILPDKKVKDFDVAGWVEVHENFEEIFLKFKEFNEKCWIDIRRKNNEELRISTFKFEHDGLTLLSMVTAGRILITISPDIKTSGKFVSVIGADDHIYSVNTQADSLLLANVPATEFHSVPNIAIPKHTNI